MLYKMKTIFASIYIELKAKKQLVIKSKKGKTRED